MFVEKENHEYGMCICIYIEREKGEVFQLVCGHVRGSAAIIERERLIGETERERE